MKFLHDILEKQKPLFDKGGKFEKFHYLFEAGETFMFTPATVNDAKGVQVRDAIDLKRLMMTVVIALLPALIFGMWNVGYQHFLATGDTETATFLPQFLLGLKLVLPIVIVSYAAGGLGEVIFAIIRKHPINEGFLVTGLLIPMVVPATIPLWQVALASLFAVVMAKEVFGGTGMNILNVALTARAFLYFAYPAEISGDKVWTYLGDTYMGGLQPVDGFTGATFLNLAASASSAGQNVVQYAAEATQSWAPGLYSLESMFLGTIPGSIGETSTLMCLVGAAILIATGVGSYRIILSGFAGAAFLGFVFNLIGFNEYALVPFEYQLVAGGLAFGVVFMATDPVTASQTAAGQWVYGFMIGVLTVLIRVVNPAYPEGIMLAILLMNVFAPLIDWFVVNANKKRRVSRATV